MKLEIYDPKTFEEKCTKILLVADWPPPAISVFSQNVYDTKNLISTDESVTIIVNIKALLNAWQFINTNSNVISEYSVIVTKTT